ncbi:Serine/threonine-protein kinase HT1 [Leucoagaricus sp. SymC.cos]|nr:Serine/threonine-protein kinase HT1 [Leucoagaricus sp. SymC.cos]
MGSSQSRLSTDPQEREALATRRHQRDIVVWLNELSRNLEGLMKLGKERPLSHATVQSLLDSKRNKDIELNVKQGQELLKDLARYLKDLIGWVEDPRASKQLQCFLGPSDDHKSAVVLAFAKDVNNSKQLGAALTLPRNYGVENDMTTLVTTVACQLADNLPSTYKDYIFDAIAQDPFILKLDLRTQFHKLIVEPFRFGFHKLEKPFVIIIDGLECSTLSTVQLEIFSLIKDYVDFTPAPPFLWFVTTQDERITGAIKRGRSPVTGARANQWCKMYEYSTFIPLVNAHVTLEAGSSSATPPGIEDHLSLQLLRSIYDILTRLFDPLALSSETDSAKLGGRQLELLDRCRILLENIIGSQFEELITLANNDAQLMADFLSHLLRYLPTQLQKRNEILQLLCKLAISARVFPASLKLEGVEYDPSRGRRVQFGSSEIYEGVYQGKNVNIKAKSIREVIIFSHISHNNILPILGLYFFGENNPQPRLVSPAPENYELLQFLKQWQGPRMPLVRGIISGLQYLHSLDIVLGGLQASNILVSRSGQAMLAELQLDSYSFVTTLATRVTHTINKFLDLFRWTAPELFQNDQVKKKESDMWALGCTCFEVVTGNKPFPQFKRTKDFIAALLKPSQIKLTCNEKWDDDDDRRAIMTEVVDRCCEYEPEHRPTADKLLESIPKVNSQFDHDPASTMITKPASAHSTVVENATPTADNRTSVELVATKNATPSPAPLNTYVPDLTSARPPFARALPGPTDESSSFDQARSWLIDFASYPNVEADVPVPGLEYLRVVKTLTTLDNATAQQVVDFLDQFLLDHGLNSHKWNRILGLLYLTATSTEVIPRRLELEGLKFTPDFGSPMASGGSSYIFKERFHDRIVCVKVLRPTPRNYMEYLVKRFIGELVISAHTSHEHILPFYGVYKSDSQVWCCVSRWMEEGSLINYLDRRPDAPRIPLIADIISGLDHLHGMDIIHGDVKGANVLIANDRCAVLADFGLSQPVSAFETRSSVGSIHWTAPEKFLNDNEVLQQTTSDIWSFACTCYEVLTGFIPFHGFTTALLIHAMFTRKVIPSRPDTVIVQNGPNDGELAKDIWTLMEHCWNYDPTKRPLASNIKESISQLVYTDNRVPRSSNSPIFKPTEPTVEIDYDRVWHVLKSSSSR